MKKSHKDLQHKEAYRRQQVEKIKGWQAHYQQRRYLKSATSDQLTERSKDLCANLATLSRESRLVFPSSEADKDYWLCLFIHVQEEYKSRKKKPLDIAYTSPTKVQILALEKYQSIKPGQALIKFGKYEDMRNLFESGNLKISPASSYFDPSLNHAIYDNELMFDQYIRGEEVCFKYPDKQSGEIKNMKPVGDVHISTGLKTDYYVYCMTHTLKARLFNDFSADSCVIIRDVSEFSNRLKAAVQSQLSGWSIYNYSVEYIDPYDAGLRLSDNPTLNLFFSKHFRYWYQQEYRFIWIPSTCMPNNLEPFQIELGSLRKLAELVDLQHNQLPSDQSDQHTE